jgi:TfoX/Sxy family transcriptional regulator of competence genes
LAVDAELHERVRLLLAGDMSISERAMFGGIAFMCNGNMAVGIVDTRLMVRVGRDRWQEALLEPHVTEMDFTGRSMRGFVYVMPEGLVGGGLKTWVEKGIRFAASLPPK